MEMALEENSHSVENVSNDDGHHYLYFGDAEPRYKISTGSELLEILSIIAATGKFWHPWDMLKTLLSYKLKQVLSEYPEAQMASDQPASSLGEPYADLVKRLDEALHSFIEGPPFTLQRLCEILLDARSIYSNLSKLALALEKNLLVTSTLTVSTTDPYPTISREGDGPITVAQPDPVVPKVPTDAVQNGVELTGADEDEEMADAEEVVDEGNKNIMETTEETNSGTTLASSDLSTPSEPSSEPFPLSEQQQQPQPQPQPQPQQDQEQVQVNSTS